MSISTTKERRNHRPSPNRRAEDCHDEDAHEDRARLREPESVCVAHATSTFFLPNPFIWLQFGVSFHLCFERVLYKMTTPSSSSVLVPLKKGLQVLFRVSPLLLPFSKKKGTWQNQNTFRWLDTSRWGRRPTVYVKRHSF